MDDVFAESNSPDKKSTLVRLVFKNGFVLETTLDCGLWDFWYIWTRKFRKFKYHNHTTGENLCVNQKDVIFVYFKEQE